MEERVLDSELDDSSKDPEAPSATQEVLVGLRQRKSEIGFDALDVVFGGRRFHVLDVVFWQCPEP